MPINSFLYPGAKVTTGYDVANSLRFNDGSSDYLTRTNSGTGSTSKSTISLWTKRSGISSYQDIWESFNDNSNYFRLRFRDDNRLDMQSDISNSTVFLKRTTRVFRDPSAWYHICVAIDLTQSNADKIKLYINGTRETAFDSSTDLTSTSQQFVGGGGSYNFTIGRHPSSDAYYDGYMAEYVFVDGQALDPTSFGEFDEDSGIWKPIDVSGLTFGNNGFYLDFENSGSLGADVSGNDNDFTVNNLTATDQSTDTCTNNMCTWNFLDRYYTQAVFSEGNTVVQTPNASQTYCTSTFALSSGKWYVEVLTEDGSNRDNIGIVDSISLANDSSNNLYEKSKGYSYRGWTTDPGVWNNGSKLSGTFASYGSPNTISIALDLDNNKLYFAKDGVWQNSGDPTSGATGTGAISITAASDLSSGRYFIAVGDEVTSDDTTYRGNFGSPFYAISSGNTDGNGYGNFEYAVPSGYYALNTKNLAEYG